MFANSATDSQQFLPQEITAQYAEKFKKDHESLTAGWIVNVPQDVAMDAMSPSPVQPSHPHNDASVSHSHPESPANHDLQSLSSFQPSHPRSQDLTIQSHPATPLYRPPVTPMDHMTTDHPTPSSPATGANSTPLINRTLRNISAPPAQEPFPHIDNQIPNGRGNRNQRFQANGGALRFPGNRGSGAGSPRGSPRGSGSGFGRGTGPRPDRGSGAASGRGPGVNPHGSFRDSGREKSPNTPHDRPRTLKDWVITSKEPINNISHN